MAKLKHCPFCGSSEIYAEVSYITKEFRIYCADAECDCVAQMRLSFADAGLGDGSIIGFNEMQTIIQQMVELWNTRAENESDSGN